MGLLVSSLSHISATTHTKLFGTSITIKSKHITSEKDQITQSKHLYFPYQDIQTSTESHKILLLAPDKDPNIVRGSSNMSNIWC